MDRVGLLEGLGRDRGWINDPWGSLPMQVLHDSKILIQIDMHQKELYHLT